MLILLNYEAVIHETLAAAKLRIAGYLQLPPAWVQVRVDMKEGSIVPTVQFDFPQDAQQQFPSARAWSEEDNVVMGRVEQVLRAATEDLGHRMSHIAG